MTLRTRISLALTLWFVAEAIALALIVQVIGVGGAILLSVATSLLGGSLLSRATGLRFQPEGERLRLVDPITGETILWPEELEPARRKERAARRAADF